MMMREKGQKQEIRTLFSGSLDMIERKLKDTSGETLIETLVALAIACLGLLLLPGAIAASARTNQAAEKYSFYAPKGESGEGQSSETTVTDGTVNIEGVSVNVKINTTTRGTGENQTTFYSYSLPEETTESDSGD